MKDYWTIERNEKGGLFVHKVAEMSMLPDWIKTDEEYGIKFATEEQAEKAVEKLEAWKRLKNGGFKFKGYYLGLGGNFSIKFETGTKCNTKDLDLLFSGEDD
jgi:hypothetical protein